MGFECLPPLDCSSPPFVGPERHGGAGFLNFAVRRKELRMAAASALEHAGYFTKRNHRCLSCLALGFLLIGTYKDLGG